MPAAQRCTTSTDTAAAAAATRLFDTCPISFAPAPAHTHPSPLSPLFSLQTTTCTYRNIIVGGCNGGNTGPAYDYLEAGIETDSDYPYTSGTAGVTGTCQADSSKFVAKTTGYTTVSSSASGEASMATYVGATGPLSICVDAETWSSYTGGIMSVCGNSVDHCVQAVGINTEASTPYWKVRNSWGTSWGESGYIQLEYGKNLCDLASDATYVDAETM